VALDPTPPPLAQLRCAWAPVHVGEYVSTMHALARIIHVAPFIKTIASLHHFHPLVEVDLPLFVDEFHLEMDLVLDKEAFIFVLMRSPRLSSNGPSSMVYELLQDYFVHDDLVSCGVDILFELCGHITCGDVLPIISCMPIASQLLVLEKQAGGI